MSDHSELKRLTETLLAIGTREDFGVWIAAYDAFAKASEPEVVLALITENEQLVMMRSIDAQTITRHQDQISELIGEGVQLKAENEALRKEPRHIAVAGDCRVNLSKEPRHD